MKPGDAPFTREQLENAIAAQESLRGSLDDAVLDTTIAALQKILAELHPDQVVEQQRKQVTVVFMDVVDSTRMMRELDPEVNMAIMDTALQKLAVPVDAHGGRVTRFMGDGYMAVFGLPTARENDPEMAVRAGLKILDEAIKIASDLVEEYRLEGFQVRIGVNTGLVVTGGITEAEDTVMGATVNLASRLESAASPGRLLISQYTFPHVRGIFDFSAVESIRVKGFAAPVQVYSVEGVKPHAFRVYTRGVEGVKTSMVGREQELKILQDSLEDVILNRKSRFITVIGEAGMGKSRLLEEFETWLDVQSVAFTILRARASLDTLDLPYALLRDLFTSHFEIFDGDQVTTVVEKIADRFSQAFGGEAVYEQQAHLVSQLLGYDLRESTYLQGVLESPKQLRDRVFVYLIDLIKAYAVEKPVVIFLDDIHWADESSLDFFDRMSEELSNQQILLVGLTRPSLFERRPMWGEKSFQQKMALQLLSRQDSEGLLRQVLQKVDDLPERLSEQIVEIAEGNPFYLEELVKMLVDQSVIVKSESTWQVQSDRLLELRIPPTLTGVIQARLDGIPRSERTVLQQASVVGKVFWDDVLTFIHREYRSVEASPESASEEVSRFLSALQNREMIYQRSGSTISDALEYLFKNAILQEVTYESVLKTTRRAYHAIIADWFIARSGDRVGEVSGLIASHLEKAGKYQEALEYLCWAAELAASNYALNEAADFYARGLVLTPDDDLERRYTLLMGQESVYGMLGNREGQREIHDMLSTIVDSLDDDHKRVELLIRNALLAHWISQYPEELAAATKAVALSKKVGDQSLTRQSYYIWAWALFHSGDVDSSLEQAKTALSMARNAGDRLAEGNALNILGLIHLSRGDFYGALGYLKDFLTITGELGDLTRKITSLNNSGVALTRLGDFQAARNQFQQILTTAQETGDSSSAGTALINLSWVAASLQEWEIARSYAEDGVARKREQEHLDAIAEGLVWLGHAWLGLNQPQKAMAAYQESLAIRSKLDQPQLGIGAVAGLARCAVAQGDIQAAFDHTNEIIEYLDGGGGLEGAWEPLRIYLTCYQVLNLAGDPRAEGILGTAYDILEEQAAQIPDPVYRGLFLENVPWHRDIMKIWQERKSHSGIV